jgi:hypothetical protein
MRLSIMGVVERDGDGDGGVDFRPVALRRRSATPEILEREGLREGAACALGAGCSTSSTFFRLGAVDVIYLNRKIKIIGDQNYLKQA